MRCFDSGALSYWLKYLQYSISMDRNITILHKRLHAALKALHWATYLGYAMSTNIEKDVKRCSQLNFGIVFARFSASQ